MGSPFGNRRGLEVLETDECLVTAFIALDGSSNVLGLIPVSGIPGAGPYTLGKGLTNSIGVSIAVQPHASTGLYNFTLDEAWFCCLGGHVTLTDQGANVQVQPAVDANVNGNTQGGQQPGTETGIAAKTVVVKFRHPTTGALTDPQASTGFWLTLILKRSGNR